MLFNFIKFDLYNGIVRQRKKIVVVCIAYILINLVYANLTYTFIKNGMIPSAKELNIGDYIAYYLFGISEYIPDKNNPFPFPFLWMFQILGCCFFCLHYPLEDLYECGKQRLILCGNRMIWWVSKSVWLFSNIILYYIIAYFSSMIVAVIFGANISSSISVYITYLIKLTGTLKDAPYDGKMYFLFIVFVVFSICMFQMALSILIKPLYSFVCIAGYLLASAYFNVPYLIDSFAMLARSELVDVEGYSMSSGCITAGVFLSISFIFGMFLFNRKDIL